MPAVLTRENLVRKIHFPRIVIPLSVVVTSMLNLAVNSIAIAVFMAAAGVPVRASWLVMIPLLGFLLVFATGLAMLLSALFVKYRDVQPIWDVVTTAAFYATPILYPIERVEIPWARELIMCNPLAVVVQQMRHSVFDPSRAERGGCDRRLRPALRADRHRPRVVRARLLGVQPHRAPRGREPLDRHAAGPVTPHPTPAAAVRGAPAPRAAHATATTEGGRSRAASSPSRCG